MATRINSRPDQIADRANPRGVAAWFPSPPPPPSAAEPELVSVPAAPPRPRRLDYGFILHFFLHVVGVLISTQLIVWGVFVFVLLAIGDLSLDGMMHQLSNLSTRYVAADPGRQAEFKALVAAADLMLVVCVLILRRNALLPARTFGGMSEHA